MLSAVSGSGLQSTGILSLQHTDPDVYLLDLVPVLGKLAGSEDPSCHARPQSLLSRAPHPFFWIHHNVKVKDREACIAQNAARRPWAHPAQLLERWN